MNEALNKYLVDNRLEGFGEYGEPCRVSVNDVTKHVEAIVGFAPISDRLKHCLTYGYDKAIKASVEFTTIGLGICGMYDGYKINSAIEIVNRYLSGDKRMEIGLKYPHFDVKPFMQRFGIIEKGVIPIDEDEYEHEAFINDGGNAFFTFEAKYIGRSGYAGAIFTDEAEGFEFVDWLLGSSAHYVKDLNIGYNNLGGVSIRKFDSIKDLSFLTKINP